MKSSPASIKFFLIAVILSALLYSPFILDITFLPRLLIFGLFAFLSFFAINRGTFQKKLNLDIVKISYLAYFIFCCASISWAHNRSEAFLECCRVLIGLTAFALTVHSYFTNKEFFFKVLFRFSIVLVFIGAAVAAYQFTSFRHGEKDALYVITGINGHKNLYTSFLFLNLFFLLYAFNGFKGLWKVLSIIAISLSLVILIALKTKAVWLGSIAAITSAGLLYLAFKKNKHYKGNFFIPLLSTLVIVNLFIVLALRPIISKGINRERLKGNSTEKIELDNERLVLWNKTYDMFKKHPVTGVGAGNWQIYLPDETLTDLWRAEELNYTFQRPHNDLLWILSETGLIGLNLFMVFIISLLIMILRKMQSISANLPAFRLILTFAFIAGFLVISFFDFPKERIEHLVLFNIICGITYSQTKDQFSFSLRFPSKIFIYGALLTLIFSLLITTLRYKGEFYTRKMYDSKFNGLTPHVISLASEAESFAYSIDPTSIPLAWYSGNAYASLNNWSKAKEELLRAYRFAPYNRNVLNDLASACAMNKENELAKKYYMEATRISPRFDEPKLNLAAIYIQEKNYEKAGECLKSLMHDSERRTNYQRIVDAFLKPNQ